MKQVSAIGPKFSHLQQMMEAQSKSKSLLMELAISPNPVNDNLSMKFIKPIDAQAKLTITNLLGESVLEIDLNPLSQDGIIAY